MLDNAKSLADLRTPSGNRLEALRGDRAGLHSIRVNDQWRVCFRWPRVSLAPARLAKRWWHEGNAFDVEIVDYH
jgi:proteic killer suppression protein